MPQSKRICFRSLATALIGISFVVTSLAPAQGGTPSRIGDDKDMCLSTMLDRYLLERGQVANGATLKTRYQLAEMLYQKQAAKGFSKKIGPWGRGLVPVLAAQRDALLEALKLADSELSSLEKIEAYLRDKSPKPLHYSTKKEKLPKVEALGDETQNSAYQKQFDQKTALLASCAQIAVFDSFSCVSAIHALRDETRFNKNMILPNVWKNFVSDPTIIEGIRQAALIMIDRIHSQQPGRVFNDLLQGFLVAGMSPGEAREASWQTLALYGNGGHNTGFQLLSYQFPDEASHAVVGLSVIGTSITYLDFFQRLHHQHHYAYPDKMVGSCTSPKPYHFWMSAYLSRWLTLNGYKSDTSQAAVFILEKGYQVNRDLNGAGSSIDKILSKPSDYPGNKVIRIDLAMAAAGSVYGSLSGLGIKSQTINPFDINDGYLVLEHFRGDGQEINQGILQKLLISNRLKLYHLWDQIFQPNKALEYYRKLQSPLAKIARD